MKKWKSLLIVAVVLSLAIMLLSPSIVAADSVTVSIDAPDEVGEGTDFIARVDITEVVNFDSCQYDVTYDPTVLEATDVTDGIIGETAIAVDMWDFIPAGTQGKIRVLGNVPGIPGVSGSGYLAEIHFNVVGSAGDTSNIAISGGKLFDYSAGEIPATWVGDSVQVSTALDAAFSASPLEGVAGATEFTFTDATSGGKASYTYEWDFDNDGTTDSTAASPTHTYASAGTYTVSLTVTDSLPTSNTETKAGYISVYDAGDADEDGDVDMGDITKVERIIMGLDDSTPGADADQDGDVDMGDITQIELIIIGS